MKISSIRAREILDSRGNPTLEAEVSLDDGATGRAAVPSGASTGAHEALELRDGDQKRYGGMGVLKAVAKVNDEIARALIGKDASKQDDIDTTMIALDGTEDKSRLGANATLAVSLAAAHAAARAKATPLFEHIRSLSDTSRDVLMPLPLCNILNGGAHAAGSTDFQEFLIAPISFSSFSDALRASVEVFHSLKNVVADSGYATTIGDEGGFAPHVAGGNVEALALISKATEKAGYALGKDFVIALDVAASELLEGDCYRLACEEKSLTSQELIAWYRDLATKYPIRSIEDGLGEDDWSGWAAMTAALPEIQLVGDDLLVTNVKFLERAIAMKAGNAILIKPNQIGTLTETIRVVERAHREGWRCIVSHRSGETEDTTIAHLAVGLGTGQIKTGSLCRSERTAKYNELLRIEEWLGANARFAGNVFRNGIQPDKVEPAKKPMGKLLIARHCESEWNASGKWTGITDVHLSDTGFKEAAMLGHMLKNLDIKIDSAYCSEQIRTLETLRGMLDSARQFDVDVEARSAINERDYGEYTGKNKWEMKELIGEDAFNELRRGWDVPIRGGETLKTVYTRVLPFYKNTILPRLQEGKNILIVAHGNSIRALMKYIESIGDQDIADLEMIFGQIIIYDVSPEGLKLNSTTVTLNMTQPNA